MAVDKLTLPSKENAVQKKINEIIDNLGTSSGANTDLSNLSTTGEAHFLKKDVNADITALFTFLGQKRIAFKQSSSSDKLGFTLYNNSGTEKGYLEYNPSNNVDGVPLMTLGNYATASGGLTHVGFRKYSNISGANGAYNLLAPLISDAKTPFNLTTTYTNFYLPLGFTDGTNTVLTAKTGLVDISSLLPDISTKQDTLVSGTNIKTVNNTSILGSGNIDTSEIVVILQSEAEHLHYTYQDIYDLVRGSKPVYYYKESNNLFFPFIGFDSNNSIIFGLPDIYIATTGHNGFKYVYIDTNGAWHTGFDDIEVEISSKVSKSGDTMTGGLLIQKDDSSFLRCQRTDAIKGTTPSSSKYWGVHFLDSEGGDAANRLGSVEARYTNTGTTRTDLVCNEPTSGSTTVERISIGCSPTDGFYTYAPKPIASSDTNNIATTDWVNDNISYRANDTVTGDQDVSAFLTSSKQRVYFTVHLPKKLNKISTITVTKMLIHLRIPTGGYLVSDRWNALSNSTITASNEGQSINVILYSTSAFSSYTNNLPICGMVEFGFKFT